MSLYNAWVADPQDRSPAIAPDSFPLHTVELRFHLPGDEQGWDDWTAFKEYRRHCAHVCWLDDMLLQPSKLYDSCRTPSSVSVEKRNAQRVEANRAAVPLTPEERAREWSSLDFEPVQYLMCWGQVYAAYIHKSDYCTLWISPCRVAVL